MYFCENLMEMKKLSALLLAVAAVAVLACNESDVKKYAISGTGLEDGAQVLLVDQITGEAIDTAVVANGAFTLKGTAPKDAFLNITSDKSNWSFMLFNDGKPVQVNYADLTLKGSDLNNKLAECDAKTDALYQEYNAFINELVALPREEQEAKMPEYEEWFKKLGECYVSVVEENKDNLIPVAFIRNVLDLKKKIEESAARQKAAEEKKQAIIGQKFLDLEEPDVDGKMHKLSEYVGKGKWVLVDFWASWCGPCEAEMPNVVAAYKKYHKKGFDIVGLSFDREKDPWVKAIKDWDMPWIHLSDIKYWNSLASDVYSVNSIPDNLLIDPEGTVVARCLRGEALEAKLAEIFN